MSCKTNKLKLCSRLQPGEHEDVFVDGALAPVQDILKGKSGVYSYCVIHFKSLVLQIKMPYTRVCIHYVWATKYRKPILIKPFREMLFNHIKQNAFAKGIHIDRINGYVDHAHCLVFLKPTQTINDIVQLIKGESAHWFNQQANAPPSKLQWQSDYFAVSVSESAIPNVQRYIDNQEAHHQRKTFLQEYNAFLKYHGFNETN